MVKMSPIEVTTGVQQIVMRFMGVMIEKNILSQQEVVQILADSASTLRGQPTPANLGGAKYIEMLIAQLGHK